MEEYDIYFTRGRVYYGMGADEEHARNRDVQFYSQQYYNVNYPNDPIIRTLPKSTIEAPTLDRINKSFRCPYNISQRENHRPILFNPLSPTRASRRNYKVTTMPEERCLRQTSFRNLSSQRVPRDIVDREINFHG